MLTKENQRRTYTIYQLSSFVPLLRMEGKRPHISSPLAEAVEQTINMPLTAEVKQQLNALEPDLINNTLTEAQQAWLKQSQLTPEQLSQFSKTIGSADLSECSIQYYNCNHLGTPQALVNQQGHIVWQAEYDPWGNMLEERNPAKLYQPLRMQGQHYDEESGLHYNRYRYYDPHSGRYVTQDPSGLLGGMNGYQYPLNPIQRFDSLGLWQAWDDASSGACSGGICEFLSMFVGPKKYSNQDDAALNALKKINKKSIKENREYAGMICQDSSNRCFSTTPVQGSLAGANPHDSPCPQGTSSIGDYHTHGNYSDVNGNPVSPSQDAYDSLHFSPQDIRGITSDGQGVTGYTGYLGTPAETYFKFTPTVGNVEVLQ